MHTHITAISWCLYEISEQINTYQCIFVNILLVVKGLYSYLFQVYLKDSSVDYQTAFHRPCFHCRIYQQNQIRHSLSWKYEANSLFCMKKSSSPHFSSEKCGKRRKQVRRFQTKCEWWEKADIRKCVFHSYVVSLHICWD